MPTRTLTSKDAKQALYAVAGATEIAYELAETRRTLLAGTTKGEIPVPHGSRRMRVMFRAIRFLGHRVVRTDTRLGRKLGPKVAAKGPPLIRRGTRLDPIVLSIDVAPTLLELGGARIPAESWPRPPSMRIRSGNGPPSSRILR